MPVISRAKIEKQLVPGIKTVIGLAYKQYPEQWSKIFDVQTSERSFEEELKLIGFGKAKNKPEGEAIEYDEAGEAWAARYIMETYALGFMLTQEAMDDNLYDSLGSRYSRELGRAMKKTKEIVCANVLNFGFSSSVTGGDGQPLFSQSHPTASGAVNSNMAATGTDLTEGTLENALIQISQFQDERGGLIAGEGVTLIIPPQMQFVAKRLLGSPYRPGTNDNDINALRDMGMLPGGFVVNRYLTDPDAFFIKTDVPDGLKLFQRKKLAVEKSADFDTGNLKFKATERYAVGYTDPLGIWASPGN